MRRRRLAPVVLATAVLGAGVLGAVPAHAEVGIRMLDNRFTPSTRVVAQGERVVFTNFGRVIHDAWDGSGLGAFDTGLVEPPDSVDAGPLPGAGRYRYYCTFHPEMTGRLDVPVKVSRKRTPAGTAVTVRWAARPKAGLVFDVQRRRPGATRFVDWRRGATAAASRWQPAAKGAWAVRARVRSTATGEASAWSPVATLRVT